tara:strand:- start:6342 stop:6866 length:525 start_codon:yes stop_codon:yes gene_type:complete
MNIFFTDLSPHIAAISCGDSHVVKMPSEVTQMIVESLRQNDCPQHLLPLAKSTGEAHKGGYPHHPATKWTMMTRSNFNWVLEWGIHLCEEYTHRYGKTHYCEEGLRHIKDKSLNRYIKRGKLRKPPRCFKGHDDLIALHISPCGIEANREYYRRDKAGRVFWNKNRSEPKWWTV